MPLLKKTTLSRVFLSLLAPQPALAGKYNHFEDDDDEDDQQPINTSGSSPTSAAYNCPADTGARYTT